MSLIYTMNSSGPIIDTWVNPTSYTVIKSDTF